MKKLTLITTLFFVTALFSSALACSIPASLSANPLPSGDVELSWAAVSGATAYRLEIEAEEGGFFELELTVNTNAHLATGLSAGPLYKFKVRALCGGEKSDWSGDVFFTLSGNGNGGGNGGGNPTGSCGIPIGLSVSAVTDSSATLSWQAAPGVQQYEVEVEDDENTPPFVFNAIVTDTFFTVLGLSPNGQYQFKVKSKCSNGNSDYSAWFFFGAGAGNGGGGNGGGNPTGSCGIPVGLSATGITGGAVLLSWASVPGAGRYEVEVEDDENTPPFVFNAIVMDTFVAVAGLSPDGQYQFKVKSKCSAGNSDYSAWFFFGAGAGNGGGGNGGGNPTGSCGIPTALTAANITSTTALLSWASVPGALRYEVEVEDDENTPAYEFDAISMDTAIMVIGLAPGGQYQFKVKARCSGGNSDYSGWHFFTTPMNAQAPAPTPENALIVAPQSAAQGVSVRMYPNPARPNSNVILDFDYFSGPAEVNIRLADMQGRTQWSQQFEGFEGGTSVEMPIGALPAGLYQVVVQSGRQVQSYRLAVSGR